MTTLAIHQFSNPLCSYLASQLRSSSVVASSLFPQLLVLPTLLIRAVNATALSGCLQRRPIVASLSPYLFLGALVLEGISSCVGFCGLES